MDASAKITGAYDRHYVNCPIGADDDPPRMTSICEAGIYAGCTDVCILRRPWKKVNSNTRKTLHGWAMSM